MKTLNCHYEMFNTSIIKAEDCHIIDENGKRYVDFEAGVWCASLGHNNKRINDAIIKQLNSVSHVGYRYTSKIVDEAAYKVLNLLNFQDGKCVFLSSGSEAVEFGVKVAKKITNRLYFLRLSNYYLSAYGVSASNDSNGWISLDLSTYCGDPSAFLHDVPFDKIGAFVFEPGNASGTAKLPPKELISKIVGRLEEHGGLIVVDEVTTGIGRTGKYFGFEHYDMCPDIVSLGKGIGNGYPVSVVGLSKQVVEKIGQTDFRYAQSHQDDPLGCAVVKEVLSVIEENDYIRRAAEMGAVLERELKSLMDKHECIKQVRGVGLMYVIEFWKDSELSLEKIHRELFDAGYIVGFHVLANVLRFYPPLTIEETQIKDMTQTLNSILGTAKKDKDFTKK